MNILLITQKVDKNDPILGFFHEWIKLFAREYDSVLVICLFLGQYDLPKNVKVLSLGKEKKKCKFFYLFNFYYYIWKERNNYNQIFVHMNQIYVILGWLLWKLMNKNIFLWYTHKKIGWSLVLAEKIVDLIFSASKESFKLPTSKLVVTGHGIDTSKFSPLIKGDRKNNNCLEILSVSRISESKKIKELVLLAKVLEERGINFIIKVIGCPVLQEDAIYLSEVKKNIIINNLNHRINFIGAVSNDELPLLLRSGDVFINLSSTGSMDKAILEAMSCGLNILTSNLAFKDILPQNNFCDSDDPVVLADKLMILLDNNNSQIFRSYIKNNHELSLLVRKISDIMKKVNLSCIKIN